MSKFNNRGSITLESAVVLPFFLLTMLSIVSLICTYRAHSELQSIISDAVMEETLYSYAFQDENKIPVNEISEDYDGDNMKLVDTVMSDAYGYYRVSKQFTKENGQAINALTYDISLLNFVFNNSGEDYININLSYYTHPLFNIAGAKDSFIRNSAYAHKWNGYGENENTNEEERIVYVAENGSVYHLSKTCTYINPGIEAVDASLLDTIRNENGGIFKACDKCKPVKNGTLFITDYGDKYHSSLTCSGLKRTIRAVKISEVNGLPACSKCGK